MQNTMAQISILSSRKRKKFVFLAIICIFTMYFICTNLLFPIKTRAITDKDEYEIYTLYHQNPSCPAMNETEWKIYKELTTPNVFVSDEERLQLSLKDLGMVTFVSKSHIAEAFVNCESIKNHSQLRSLPYTIFFSPDVTKNLTLKFREACPHANIIIFPFEKFPANVRKLGEYRFKVMYEAMTLKNHKIMLNFDTSIIFNQSADYEKFITSTIRSNPLDVTMLRTAGHNMISTTHPKTYNCFPNIKPEGTRDVAQYQGGLILWVASLKGWETMKRFVECSLQEMCIAPPGSTKACSKKKISTNQTKFSGCHRFDQAVINLILYENSNFRPEIYQKQSNLFKIVRRA